MAHGLYKECDLADNAHPDRMTGVTDQDSSAGTENSWNQPEVHDVYAAWRKICDSYPGDRMLVGEVFLFDVTAVAGYVGDGGLNQSFNFLVMRQPFDAGALQTVAKQALETFAACNSLPTWVLSNHDLVRHATRYGGGDLGRQRGLAVTAFLLGLPGSPYLYEGEELGSEEVFIPEALREDPIWERSGHLSPGRDGCRTPIPWTGAAPGFGFTSGPSAWLPFAPDAGTRNVADQLAEPASVLNVYRHFLAVRRDQRDRLSDTVSWLADMPAGVSGYRRTAVDGGADLLVLLNTAETEMTITLSVGGSGLTASTRRMGAPGSGVTLPARSTAWLTVR